MLLHAFLLCSLLLLPWLLVALLALTFLLLPLLLLLLLIGLPKQYLRRNRDQGRPSRSTAAGLAFLSTDAIIERRTG